MSTPRPEYPRPQFVRRDWLNLNGEWQFEIDAGDSGVQRGLHKAELSGCITVPFCPESSLSGVGHVDFMNAVWYRRTVTIPGDWVGRDMLLHFQAVDYDATVWVNGTEVGRHRGGFTPFSCDLRGIVKPGEEATIVVRARDVHNTPQAKGKQSDRYAPHGCHYTRTTGIWQTVWMEPIPECALKRPRLTPDVANGAIRLEQPITQNRPGLRLRATLRDADGIVTTAETRADLDFAPRLDLVLPEEKRRLWSPTDPFLYDLTMELVDAGGEVVDRAESYAGLRSVAIDGKKVKINGETVFQRLVLDQGYYPDGVMTAPSDDALERDIRLSQEAGFNGARLHQKVFEERFLYHADRLGYLVWGEFADWGSGGHGPAHDHQQPGATYITQWLEALQRDYSHPSIIGWCGLNETWQTMPDRVTVLDDVTRGMFLAAKAMDTTRPVLDTSGYSHRVPETDVYDSHDYEQDPGKFAVNQAGLASGTPHMNKHDNQPVSLPYRGQPYFVSEFGGIHWAPTQTDENGKPINPSATADSWGYGQSPRTLEDFYARFEGLCDVLLDNPLMFGYVYTQLTDVYPEENGIYRFDRTPKFDNARLHAIQTRKASIEEDGKA
jgi:beta-galactosidase/beta-glucuronidase